MNWEPEDGKLGAEGRQQAKAGGVLALVVIVLAFLVVLVVVVG